jgi:hypothetical protein
MGKRQHPDLPRAAKMAEDLIKVRRMSGRPLTEEEEREVKQGFTAIGERMAQLDDNWQKQMRRAVFVTWVLRIVTGAAFFGTLWLLYETFKCCFV